MNSDCKHENFGVVAEVNRLTKSETDDTVLAFAAKFAVHCTGCGKAFEFASPREAVRSLNREQLSMNIKPSCGVVTPFRTRVHIADQPKGGQQKCFRCDTVLAETRSAWHSPAGQQAPASPFWPVGKYIGILERTDGDPTNPVSLFVMDHDAEGADEIHCGMPF